jgi:hypothetical protein
MRVTVIVVFLLGISRFAGADTLDAIKHPYQQTVQQSGCAGGYCILLFPVTTATRTLVSHTSCFIALSTGDFPSQVLIEAYGVSNPAINNVPVTSMGANAFVSGITNFVANAETYIFFEKSTQPAIYIATNQRPAAVTCNISGYYLD